MPSFALEIIDRSGIHAVPLSRLPFTIGRDPDNDLALPFTSVSRHHAAIEHVGDALVVIDRNSRNHVFVNGKQVGRAEIREGDLLRIGTVDMRLAKSPGVRIPAASARTDTVFYPHQASWDPIQTLSSVFSVAKPARERRKEPDWQRILHSSMDTRAPHAYGPILDAIEECITFDRCFLILFEGGSPERIKVLARRARREGPEGAQVPAADLFVSREILRRVARSREAVVASPEDRALGNRDSFIRSGARTALCLPLVVRNRVIGVLYLDRLSSLHRFSRDEIETLGPVSGILALKIENAQLLEAHIKAQLDRRELEIAESIQRSLYPTEPVLFPGFSVEGATRPCQEVGGDYFDFIRTGENDLVWVLGDVSGKGLPSALYMVSILSTLRAHLRDGLELQVIMQGLEKHVRETFRADYFLTLFLARLDAASGVLTYCNAGHIPPIVLRESGELLALEGSDPALNIYPWQDFRCHHHQFDPGDLLVAYTDGLIECEGKKGELFGVERAVEQIRRQRDADLAVLRRDIFDALDAFSTDDGLRDDVTMVLLRKEPT